MKTPIQELIDKLNALGDSSQSSNKAYAYYDAAILATNMLNIEKNAICKFARLCRNIMAADEYAIEHWYNKTFNDTQDEKE